MKTLYIVILFFAICFSTTAQNIILNGSFENNIATGNTPGLGGNWSVYVSDSWEVDGGQMNLDTSYACGTASDGMWFVTNCPGCPPSNYAAFSFGLSTPVLQGNIYTLSFDKEYCGDSTAIEVGLTNDTNLVGTLIQTFTGPTTQTWVHESFVFQAPITANFLSVSVNIVNFTTGLIALDNFKLEPDTCSAFYTLSADTIPHNWIALNQASGTPPINYTWYWGDGDSSTGATPSHIYTTPGNYNICLTITDSNSCTDTYCDSSTYLFRSTEGGGMISVNVVNSTTAIHEPVTNGNTFSIYPNPANDKITIKINSELKNGRIEIFNVMGEMIDKKIISNLSSIEISLSNISEGIYFVKISDGVRESARKLVVQKD